MPPVGERKDKIFHNTPPPNRENKSVNSPSPEISLHPSLKPVVRITQQVIDSSLPNFPTIGEPIVTRHPEGLGQNWSWIRIVPALSQSSLCAVLGEDMDDVVNVTMMSTISDESLARPWEMKYGGKNWHIKDLLVNGEERERFERELVEVLKHSWEDLDDREMILDSLRRLAR